MPEGHTIHRAARDHEQDLRNQPVRISSPQGRFDAEAVAGPEGETRLLRVEACGKHLFYFFEGEQIVHVHLGLFGKFKRRRSPAPEPRPTTRMRLEGAKWTIDLVGPTACEVITTDEMGELMARLGPDPLRDDADPTIFYRSVKRSRAPIGAILMDQSRIAGVGNVYRAEVLHLEGIHRDTPGSKVPAEKLEALWLLIVGLLRRGVEEKRIVTTRGAHAREAAGAGVARRKHPCLWAEGVPELWRRGHPVHAARPVGLCLRAVPAEAGGRGGGRVMPWAEARMVLFRGRRASIQKHFTPSVFKGIMYPWSHGASSQK
jgi:formamidopyrimidine-DNA glycosylase